MKHNTVFEYMKDYQGYAAIGNVMFPVVLTKITDHSTGTISGMGYIHPRDEAQAAILRDKGLKEVDVELLGLSEAEVLQRNLFLDKLKGVLSEEQIEEIQLLPQSGKDQIAENIDAIIGSFKTKNPVPVISPVKEADKGSENKIPTFDESNVKGLIELLQSKKIEIPKDAKKQELYDLAYPKS